MSRPLSRIVPSSEDSSPDITFRSVDLPAPLEPIRAVAAPRLTLPVTPRRTWLPLNRFRRPRNSSIGGVPDARQISTSRIGLPLAEQSLRAEKNNDDE